MKCLTVVLTTMLFAAAMQASAVTPGEMERALTGTLDHPYLYFTADDVEDIRARIGSDPETADILARLTAEGNRLMYTPVDHVVPRVSPHSRFDDDFARRDYQRHAMDAAHTLAFLHQITGDVRYAEKSFEFADVVCDLTDWTDRAHQFPIIYSRVWPHGAADDQVVFSFDIEAADTAIRLAAVYDWLYDWMDVGRRDRIRGALMEKAILRVRGNWEYHWWASAYRCNWSAIGYAGPGTAALALLTEQPELVDVVARAHEGVTMMLDEIGVDGGWAEGCGYYRKGVHAMNFFADPLKRLTGGEFDLYEHPRLAANPITFLLHNTITPGRLIPLEDSAYNRAGTSSIWNKLAAEAESGETVWFRNYIFGAGNGIFDVIWPRADITPRTPDEPSIHFRTIDWTIMRSDFTDPDHAVIASTAGGNADPHHGHLDAGHFVVYWRGQGFVSELGSAAYDEKYFDEARWEYPQASSVGHNVILVDGGLQEAAKRKNTPWRTDIGGRIVSFSAGEDRDYTSIDASGAYPDGHMKGWRRHIMLQKPDITVVVDEIVTEPGAEIEARWHSETDMVGRDGWLLLDGDAGDMALIPSAGRAWEFRADHHPILPAKLHARFERLPYCGVVTAAGSERTVLVTVILPVGNDAVARAVRDSIVREDDADGGFRVSLVADGRKIAYRFTRDGDWLAPVN